MDARRLAGFGVTQPESRSHLHGYWPWALGSVILPACASVFSCITGGEHRAVCIKELFVHPVMVWDVGKFWFTGQIQPIACLYTACIGRMFSTF